jgi:hypothetical protein
MHFISIYRDLSDMLLSVLFMFSQNMFASAVMLGFSLKFEMYWVLADV